MESNTLREADKIINGERQDQYGSPEDSFAMIANFWTAYIANKGDVRIVYENGHYTPLILDEKDVALLMTLFKIARMQGQGYKRDNAIDACGYLAIYNDRLQDEEPEKEIHPSQREWSEDEEILYCSYPAFFSDLVHMAERVEVKKNEG